MMSVGNSIKYLRKKKKMSQVELGNKVNLSASQISNIESEKRATTYEKLVEIADALDCKVSDLYGEDEKLQQDDAWIIFTEEMKREGIKPEQAKKWIQLAKKFIEENE